MKARAVIACIARFTMVALVVAVPMRKATAQTSAEYFTWGTDANSSVLNYDQGGSIELGQPYTGGPNPINGGVPYIDFHYGNGEAQDFNYRIMNSGDNILSFKSTNNDTPLKLELNSIQVNGGVDATGTGIKHVSSNASCTTGGSIGDTCILNVPWPGAAFADTNYTVTCTPKVFKVSANGETIVSYSITIPDADKTTTGVNVVLENLQDNLSVEVDGINCIAVHD